jgi:hypothetical protein
VSLVVTVSKTDHSLNKILLPSYNNRNNFEETENNKKTASWARNFK